MSDPVFCADVLAVGAVKGGRAVAVREGGAAVELTPELARMLQLIDSYRSPQAHAAVVCRELGLPADYAEEAAEMLSELVELGVVSTAESLRAQLAAGPTGTPSSVQDVAIPTRERPRQLGRCIDTIAAEARQHGRSLTVRVFDDAVSADAAAATLEVLSASKNPDLRLRYANQEDKRQFGRELAARAGVPPDVVAFALADPLGIGLTIGANRNAALLDLAGRSFVFLDDDMECRLAEVAARQEGVRLAQHPRPDTTYYGSTERAIEAGSFAGESLIGAIERHLGRSVADFTGSDGLRIDGLDGRTARRFRRAGGAAEVVAVGCIGDSGGLPESALFPSPRPGAHPFGFFEGDEPPVGRGIDRGVTELTLATRSGLMTGACGLQNRGLPPFPPVLRNEDGAFATVFNAMAPTGLIAHLPWRAVHRPEGRDDLALERDGRMPSLAPTGGNAYLQLCVSSVEAGLTATDRAGRLVALGRHLRELGGWPPADLRELLLPLVMADATGRLNRLEESRAFWLERDPPPAWRELTRRYLDQLHGDLVAGAFVVPIDLAPRADNRARAAFARLQAYVTEYGRLLEYWPALAGAASDLAERGVSLTRAVE